MRCQAQDTTAIGRGLTISLFTSAYPVGIDLQLCSYPDTGFGIAFGIGFGSAIFAPGSNETLPNNTFVVLPLLLSYHSSPNIRLGLGLSLIYGGWHKFNTNIILPVPTFHILYRISNSFRMGLESRFGVWIGLSMQLTGHGFFKEGKQ